MKLKIIILLLLCICVIRIGSVDIGSDTAVTRFNTVQNIADGDRVAGFAALAAGFTFNTRAVEATWDSFFPISGPLRFNLGTLNLNLDFIMHNVSEIVSIGNINANCHRFELSPKAKCIPETGAAFGCTVSPIATGSVFAADAQVNSIDWGPESTYLVAGTNDGGTDQVYVLFWDADTQIITEVDAVDVGANVNSVAWHPTLDWIAVGRDSGVGDELYTYTFNRATETLTLLDSVNLGGGGNDAAKGVAWHPDGDFLGVARQSSGAGAKYVVYPIDTAGNFGTPVSDGTNANGISVDWNIDGTYIAFGTEASGSVDELRVYAFTKTPSLTLNATAAPGLINSISWNKEVGGASNDVFLIGRQAGTNRIEAYRHDGGAGTITLLDGSAGTQVNSVHWYPDGDCFAAGLQDNSEGTGGELRSYSWLPETDTIRQDDDQEISEDVLAVRNSPDGKWLAIGDDGLGGGTPEVSMFFWDSAFTDNQSVYWDQIQLGMNCNILLRDTIITFSGDSVINGRGNMLTLATTVTLRVAENAGLMFKDVTVKGVGGTNIVGLDETSSFTFQDTTFVLENDYTFTVGHFEVIKDFRIMGDGKKFIYGSDQVSLIRGGLQQLTEGDDCALAGFCGCMILEKGTTFDYVSELPDRLQLDDPASCIIMHSATMKATNTLQLTTGLLQIDGKSSFDGGCIEFGDCTTVNNLCVELLPAANLEVTAGKLVNKNL